MTEKHLIEKIAALAATWGEMDFIVYDRWTDNDRIYYKNEAAQLALLDLLQAFEDYKRQPSG